MNITLREIEENDFYKSYLELFSETSSIDFALFSSFVNNLKDNHKIFVIEHEYESKIIGSITLIIEEKLIHNMGKVCHVEDVVIHPSFQKNGLGKYLIDFAKNYACSQKCYKIILDCMQHNVEFYKKCDFIEKGHQMAIYF